MHSSKIMSALLFSVCQVVGCGSADESAVGTSQGAISNNEEARAAGYVTLASSENCNNHAVQAYGATYCVVANIWTNNAGMAATSTDLYMFGGSRGSLDTWVSAYNGPNLNDNQRRAGLQDTNSQINGGRAIQENTWYYGPLDKFAINRGDRLISNGGFEAGDNLTLASVSVQNNF